jgi:hypothetical protein
MEEALAEKLDAAFGNQQSRRNNVVDLQQRPPDEEHIESQSGSTHSSAIQAASIGGSVRE